MVSRHEPEHGTGLKTYGVHRLLDDESVRGRCARRWRAGTTRTPGLSRSRPDAVMSHASRARSRLAGWFSEDRYIPGK